MRKAIRIKAAILIVAWSAIFLHGVVPHNHIEGSSTGCQNFFHYTNLEKGLVDRTIRFGNNPSEKSGCTWSGYIYHNVNSENLLIFSEQSMLISSPEVYNSKACHSSVLFITDPHKGISSLRAPPLS